MSQSNKTVVESFICEKGQKGFEFEFIENCIDLRRDFVKLYYYEVQFGNIILNSENIWYNCIDHRLNRVKLYWPQMRFGKCIDIRWHFVKLYRLQWHFFSLPNTRKQIERHNNLSTPNHFLSCMLKLSISNFYLSLSIFFKN